MLDHRRSGPRRHQASSIRASGHTLRQQHQQPVEDVDQERSRRRPGRSTLHVSFYADNIGRSRDQHTRDPTFSLSLSLLSVHRKDWRTGSRRRRVTDDDSSVRVWRALSLAIQIYDR
ncbi:hypothetical protein ANTRET_LOCUS9306 [Anthophora retusa]